MFSICEKYDILYFWFNWMKNSKTKKRLKYSHVDLEIRYFYPDQYFSKLQRYKNVKFETLPCHLVVFESIKMYIFGWKGLYRPKNIINLNFVGDFHPLKVRIANAISSFKFNKFSFIFVFQNSTFKFQKLFSCFNYMCTCILSNLSAIYAGFNNSSLTRIYQTPVHRGLSMSRRQWRPLSATTLTTGSTSSTCSSPNPTHT